MTMQEAMYVPVPEAARLMSIGETLCWAMINRGELHAVRFGRRVMVPRAAIEQLSQATQYVRSQDTTKAGRRGRTCLTAESPQRGDPDAS